MQNEEQSNELREIRMEGKLSKCNKCIKERNATTSHRTTNNVFDFNNSDRDKDEQKVEFSYLKPKQVYLEEENMKWNTSNLINTFHYLFAFGMHFLLFTRNVSLIRFYVVFLLLQ